MAKETITEKRSADNVKEIRAAMPTEEVIYGLAELFKTFGDATRAKILSCLQVKPLCVMEIAEVLDMSMSAALRYGNCGSA